MYIGLSLLQKIPFTKNMSTSQTGIGREMVTKDLMKMFVIVWIK